MLPNIHILGIQGSGKGTQTHLLVERYNLDLLASGNLFRKRAEIDDAFGRDISARMKTGNLLPDSFVKKIVLDYFAHNTVSKGLIVDGAIRTLSQYSLFDSIWKEQGFSEPFLIHLELSDAEALKRIEKRIRENKEQRSDDGSPEAINRRIKQYHTRTEPLVKRFKESGRIVTIDASESIEDVFNHIVEVLKVTFPHLVSNESH
jgi:adenylate kinase